MSRLIAAAEAMFAPITDIPRQYVIWKERYDELKAAIAEAKRGVP